MVYFVGYAAVAIAFALAVIQLLAPRVGFVGRLLTARAGTIMTGEPLDIEKMSYDLYYLKNFTIFLDVLILLQTARVVLWPAGVR